MKNDGLIVEKVKLVNFAGFDKVEVAFTDGVNYLYGKNGSGKSRLMESIVACIKGIAEQSGCFKAKRFMYIGTNKPSGDAEWTFLDNRDASRFTVKNHITKSGNSITFKKEDGSDLSDDWFKDFLNVSLMSAKNFCTLTGKEQSVLLGIDTSSFDENIGKYKAERTYLNRKIKDTGTIEVVEKVDPIDVSEIDKEKQSAAALFNEQYEKNCIYNQKLIKQYNTDKIKRAGQEKAFEEEQRRVRDNYISANGAHDTLVRIGNESGIETEYPCAAVSEWIDQLPQPKDPEFKEIPEPDTIQEMPTRVELDKIDERRRVADIANYNAEKYADYIKKCEDLDKTKMLVEEINAKISTENEARGIYIQQHDFGFSDLNTDESGFLLYKERPLSDKYFSKGELELIVAKLATSLNPIFKTRFIDEFGVLDSDNQIKLIDSLVEAGYQPIVAVPGERVVHDNAIVIREGKIVGEEDERPELL